MNLYKCTLCKHVCALKFLKITWPCAVNTLLSLNSVSNKCPQQGNIFLIHEFYRLDNTNYGCQGNIPLSCQASWSLCLKTAVTSAHKICDVEKALAELYRPWLRCPQPLVSSYFACAPHFVNVRGLKFCSHFLNA